LPQTLVTLFSLSKLTGGPAMTKTLVEPSNLKSFQRISPEDMLYLKELGEAIALTRAQEEGRKLKKETQFLELIMQPRKVFHLLKDALDKLLYETVPADETYSSRE
jgi:hypothetical protein